jgi:predicted PurR-regulated permease PerM
MIVSPVDSKTNRFMFLTIIIVFGLLLYFSLAQFFTAFLGAVIIYVLSKTFMEKLIKKQRWNRSAAAVFVILISILIIMIPIGIASYMLYNKGKYYVANPDLLVQSLKRLQITLQNNYNITLLSDEKIAEIRASASGFISNLLNFGLNLFGSITMLYFFLYFMLININRMEAAIVFFLPFKRDKIEIFGKELVNLTFANSVGVPAIALAQGFIGYVGYVIVGLPEPGFWAVITAFTSIVPLIGTALIWVPAAVYLFVVQQVWQASFVFVWGLAVLGITDNVVRFMLAKKIADVHPIITVLGVIMGLKYFGITGLIFGPLLISYFIILLRLYYLEFQTSAPVVQKKKNIPVRFNLPFLGHQIKRKKLPFNESDRSKE